MAAGTRRERIEQERQEWRHDRNPLTLTIGGVLEAVPGLSRTQLFRELKAGRLRSFKIGHSRCIRYVDLERWLDERVEASA